MNLAIVITASQYKPPKANLPACDCDADLIAALLNSSTDFDEKLILRDVEESAMIKKKLTEFISQHKGEDIDQVFFYFSGHGDFTGNELFYLLPDYDQNLKRQTSLENSEIDSLLRGLKPNLTVKVIDACHSGVPYIKDADSFQNYIKGTKEEFNKCYFMFSSHLDQASYQNKEFSFFTKSFAQAIAEHSADPVRLKDIIDYISDAFAGNSQQTPFFVVQADFTEPFCRVTKTLRQGLKGLLSGISSGQQPPKTGTATSIADLVVQEAKAYCTQKEAIEILNRLADSTTQTPGNEEATQLYDVTSTRMSDFSEIPHIDTVANWLYENEHSLFVELLTKQRTEKVEDPFLRISDYFANKEDRKFRTHLVTYPAGLKNSKSMPYSCICVRATPKYPNTNATVCYIIPLVSETKIRIFSGFGRYKKADWSEKVLQGKFDWTTKALPLKEEPRIQDQVQTILSDFWEYTLEPVKRRLGLLKDDSEKPQDTDGEPDTSESESQKPDTTTPDPKKAEQKDEPSS